MKALIFIILFSSFGSYAQVVFDKSSHNFGLIEGDALRHVDFILTNNSDTDQTIISVRGDREVQFLISNRNIQPDSSQILRVQVNPLEDGLFSKTIDVYLSTSETSVKLRVSGIAKNLGDLTRQQCPDFSANKRTSAHRGPESIMTFTIINAVTGDILQGADLKVSPDGIIVHSLRSDKYGKTEKELEAGLYSIRCKLNGFVDHFETGYLSKVQNNIIVKLVPLVEAGKNLAFDLKEDNAVVNFNIETVKGTEILKPKLAEPAEDTINSSDKVSDYVAPIVNDKKSSVEAKPAEDSESIGEIKDFEEVVSETPSKNEFSINRYRANNIVFIIDRSSSMKEDGKMELLKSAMLDLLALLRDVDQLTIINYSSNAEVILPPTFVVDKNYIASVISDIVPKGTTQAHKGIRKGFLVADSAFIKSGNNEVILGTDGAFAEGIEKVYEMISVGAEKGIRFSVIGIKNPDWTTKQLKDLSRRGQGSFIPLKRKADAENMLRDEIKKHSLVNKLD